MPFRHYNCSCYYNAIHRVSISPTFYARLFRWKVLWESFLYIHFRLELFWRKNIGAKTAHRMSVKLTQGGKFCLSWSNKMWKKGGRRRAKGGIMEKGIYIIRFPLRCCCCCFLLAFCFKEWWFLFINFGQIVMWMLSESVWLIILKSQ